jgi:hypothetical protein
MKEQKPLNRNEILSASEIGQYTFCSISWYLQRCGYKSSSPLLELGKKSHIDLGKTIDTIQYEIKKSKRFAAIGYLLLILAIIVIILGVM